MSVDIAFSSIILPISGLVAPAELSTITEVESNFLVGKDMSIAVDAVDTYDQWKVYLSFEECFVLNMWNPSKGDMRTLQLSEEVSVYKEGTQVTINDTTCTYRAIFSDEREAAAVCNFLMKCRPETETERTAEVSLPPSPGGKLHNRMEMHKQTSLRKMSLTAPKRQGKTSVMHLFNSGNHDGEEEDMSYRSTL